jgi:hypothetical protein
MASGVAVSDSGPSPFLLDAAYRRSRDIPQPRELRLREAAETKARSMFAASTVPRRTKTQP